MTQTLSVKRWIKRLNNRSWIYRLAVYGPLALFLGVFLLIILYRFINPPLSSLMLPHYVLGKTVRNHWVPLERISRHLPRAVIMSEDAKFCRHWGVDWSAVGEALEDVEEGERPRGASTITMQTAKNLFLWPSRSYVRKALEVPLAYAMSIIWPKKRVMEIYLNVAEWGPGIFGAQAAARYHFKKNASRLTPREAALLAASLPNPFVRRAGRPGPKTRATARRIERRMAGASPWTTCLKN